MALGMEAGLDPGHIVLDGDPAPPPQKGATAPNFRPISIAAKLLDASKCHLVGGRTRAGHIVLDVTPFPSPKRGQSSPNFGPRCGQTAECTKLPLGMEVGLGPGHIMLDGDLALSKRGTAPIFDPCVLWATIHMARRWGHFVAKRLDDQDGSWRGGRSRSRPYSAG